MSKIQSKTWPYGTILAVQVVSSTPVVLAVATLDAPREGFILAGHGIRPLPPVDEFGTITFTKGGPTGGHWVYNKK